MKSPPELFAHFADLSVKKASMSAQHTLVLAFQAGVYLSLAFIATLHVIAGLSDAAPPVVGRMLGALIFPFGLLQILVSGGELLTGNFAVLSAGILARRVAPRDAARNWGLVGAGNLAGCLFIALLFGYGGEHFTSGANLAAVLRVASDKLARKWATNLIRGIGCNILVSLAVYSAAAADSVTGKAAAIWPLISEARGLTSLIFVWVGCCAGADVFLLLMSPSILFPRTQLLWCL